MKKVNKKLSLSKKIISDLDSVKGGNFTGGCTDGCSPFATAWNCTNGGCTNDCEDSVDVLLSQTPTCPDSPEPDSVNICP